MEKIYNSGFPNGIFTWLLEYLEELNSCSGQKEKDTHKANDK